jgi:hypothetical protein
MSKRFALATAFTALLASRVCAVAVASPVAQAATESEAIKDGPLSCSQHTIHSALPKDDTAWTDTTILLDGGAWLKIASPYVDDANSPFLIKLRQTDLVVICFGPSQAWSDSRLCGSVASIVYDQDSHAYMNAFAFPAGGGSPPKGCKAQTSGT